VWSDRACCAEANNPALNPVPGCITGRGHRRPRLYRQGIVTVSSAGVKYPAGLGAAPPCFPLEQDGAIGLRALRNDPLTRQTGFGVNRAWRQLRCLSGDFDAKHQFMGHLTPPLFQPAL
jgi:hypothetical protein